LRTALTALGIAVAVGSTVMFMSLGEGLRQVFGDQLANLGPDLQVTYGEAGDDLFPSAPELPTRFMAELTSAASELGIRSVTPVLLSLKGGINPSQSFIFQAFPSALPLAEMFSSPRLVEGRLLNADDEGAPVAVIGESAASRSSVGVGGQLRFNPAMTFDVVGVVESGGGLLDNFIVVPLTSMQEALGIHDRLSLIAIKLDRPERAAEAAAAIEERFPELGAQTQAGMLSVVQDSLRISDFIRLGISAIALLVGGIAVANTMMMSVFERTREFGVIRAVGARPGFLFGLVIVESVLLSLVGAAAGVLLGWVVTGVVNRIAVDYIGLAVAAITPRLVLFAAAVAMFMGLVSGLLPAGRASRIPIAVAVARE
jgi:putative ABC transport system permease protein